MEVRQRHYRDLFNEDDITFLRLYGKMLFLSYIVPLLDGDGFYHLESQLSDPVTGLKFR